MTWFTKASKQNVVKTDVSSFFTKSYLNVCREAAKAANEIEAKQKRKVIDIRLVTFVGRTSFVITHVPLGSVEDKLSKISFKTSKTILRSVGQVAKTAADDRYALMQRGKQVFSLNIDVADSNYVNELLGYGAFTAGAGGLAIKDMKPGVPRISTGSRAMDLDLLQSELKIKYYDRVEQLTPAINLATWLSVPCYVTLFFRKS